MVIEYVSRIHRLFVGFPPRQIDHSLTELEALFLINDVKVDVPGQTLTHFPPKNRFLKALEKTRTSASIPFCLSLIANINSF